MPDYVTHDTFFTTAEYCLSKGVYPDAHFMAILSALDATRAKAFSDSVVKRAGEAYHAGKIETEEYNQIYYAMTYRKARKDISGLNEIISLYSGRIIDYIIEWFTGTRRTQNAKGDFKEATTNAFGDAFDSGYVDGGGEMPPDVDDLEWYNARLQTEFGFIDALFANMKELKKEDDFDYFVWATERADGYGRTVRDIYEQAKIRAAKNKMLTFVGDDGSQDHICQSIGGTCVRLKGQRHRASWWVAHDLIPYRGNTNYDCGAWNCCHYLVDDNGNSYGGEAV